MQTRNKNNPKLPVESFFVRGQLYKAISPEKHLYKRIMWMGKYLRQNKNKPQVKWLYKWQEKYMSSKPKTQILLISMWI